jgi:LacI family transcriptional regulator
VRGQQVIQACQEANLRVPDEVAVLGAHNDELLCERYDPPMSSIRPDAQKAGREAAARFARLMAGGKQEVDVTHIDPLGVAVRQSTDIVAVADPRVAAVVRFAQSHACEGINVADLLRAVPMGRTALEPRCTESLGCTPRELLERIRLQQVKKRLRHSDVAVEAIAERTGYAYPKYLTVASQRVEGLSPRA